MTTVPPQRRLKPAIPASLVLLVGGLIALTAYWHGLHGSFFFDDGPNILLNPDLHITDLNPPALRDAWNSGIAGPLGRPVSQLSFALNHFFSGLNPFAFKLTNLVIHFLNGVLIFFLARLLLFSLPTVARHPAIDIWAALIAVAWLLHPIQLTSVLLVVQRMTSLYALFLIAAILLHIKARHASTMGRTQIISLVLAWAVFWPLALLAKETAILFPGFVLAYEWLIRPARTGRLDRSGLIFVTSIAGVALAAVIYLFSPIGESLLGGYSIRPFSLLERVLTEARVIWLYLGMIAVPRPEAFALHHDYLAISTGLLSPWTTLASISGLAALALLALWSRKRLPLLAFGIVWFLVAHSLESTVFPLEIAHEHRNYLGLFGVIVAVFQLLLLLGQRSPPFPTITIAIVSALLVWNAGLTAMRAHQFGDEIRRTQIAAMYHPGSVRANYEAGQAIMIHVHPDPDDQVSYTIARRHFEIATDLDNDFKTALWALIQLNCARGFAIDQEWLSELLHRLRHRTIHPGDEALLLNVRSVAIEGLTCISRRDVEGIFDAVFANPTTGRGVRGKAALWLAEYYVLSQGELASAESLVERHRDAIDSNAHLLLIAQIRFLEMDDPGTQTLLPKLDWPALSTRQRRLATALQDCTAPESDKCSLSREAAGPEDLWRRQ